MGNLNSKKEEIVNVEDQIKDGENKFVCPEFKKSVIIRPTFVTENKSEKPPDYKSKNFQENKILIWNGKLLPFLLVLQPNGQSVCSDVSSFFAVYFSILRNTKYVDEYYILRKEFERAISKPNKDVATIVKNKDVATIVKNKGVATLVENKDVPTIVENKDGSTLVKISIDKDDSSIDITLLTNKESFIKLNNLVRSDLDTDQYPIEIRDLFKKFKKEQFLRVLKYESSKKQAVYEVNSDAETLGGLSTIETKDTEKVKYSTKWTKYLSPKNTATLGGSIVAGGSAFYALKLKNENKKLKAQLSEIKKALDTNNDDTMFKQTVGALLNPASDSQTNVQADFASSSIAQE